jgi:hypothetical protein
MKTPRDLLLARHHAAAPKLDAVRRAVMAELNNQGTKEQSLPAAFVSSFLGCSSNLWQELIFPSRRIWSGLAAVWVLILAVNFAQHEPASAVKVSAAPMMSLREQQRWMNELFAERAPVADAAPPKIFSPKPRTEKYRMAAA